MYFLQEDIQLNMHDYVKSIRVETGDGAASFFLSGAGAASKLCGSATLVIGSSSFVAELDYGICNLISSCEKRNFCI
jgi:hypothetical protein